MDKKQREARRKQEDQALTRAMLWVAAAIVLEGLLVLLNRYYINYYLSEIDLMLAVHSGLKVLRLAAAAVALLSLVWTVVSVLHHKKITLPLLLTIAGGAFAICSHVALRYRDGGVSMLFWLVVAWAVLALIYYIYQKEFFLSATATGLSVLGLWFVRYGGGFNLDAVLCLLGIVVVLAATLLLKKNNGMLSLRTSIRILPKDAVYSVILVSGIAALVALAIALVSGTTAAYYLLLVMLAWIFALFVYFTVKLM